MKTNEKRMSKSLEEISAFGLFSFFKEEPKCVFYKDGKCSLKDYEICNPYDCKVKK